MLGSLWTRLRNAGALFCVVSNEQKLEVKAGQIDAVIKTLETKATEIGARARELAGAGDRPGVLAALAQGKAVRKQITTLTAAAGRLRELAAYQSVRMQNEEVVYTQNRILTPSKNRSTMCSRTFLPPRRAARAWTACTTRWPSWRNSAVCWTR